MCTVAAVLELLKLPYQRHVAEKLCASARGHIASDEHGQKLSCERINMNYAVSVCAFRTCLSFMGVFWVNVEYGRC